MIKLPIFHLDVIQPESRALMTFCKIANIEFETKSYSFLSQENLKSKELLKINPSGDLPFMEAEVNIQGAHTILRYLVNTRLKGGSSLYPKDPVGR